MARCHPRTRPPQPQSKVKTAIDTSVLYSIFQGEPGHRAWMEILFQARAAGQLTICDVAYAEISPAFSTQAELDQKLALLGIAYEPIAPAAAHLAGTIFRQNRDAGGPRGRMIPDFLIGAHALLQADRLASIDNGYLRQQFKRLKVLTPP